MRNYSKVFPQFWIGTTGKRIRTAGVDAQILAMYVMTSPHANMLGLYYLPLAYIVHETGLTMEGASKALASLSGIGFCHYDEATEMVWVVEMARFQVGEQLKPEDKRSKGVQNGYDSLTANPYLSQFFERYSVPFGMSRSKGFDSETAKVHVSRSEAPSKPRARARTGIRAGTESGKPDNSSASEEVLAYLNQRAGRAFEPAGASLKDILARLKEGATVEQCKGVVDSKVAEWRGDPKMDKYLRPCTLFGKEKFSEYLGALGSKTKTAGLPDYVHAGYGSADEAEAAREKAEA